LHAWVSAALELARLTLDLPALSLKLTLILPLELRILPLLLAILLLLLTHLGALTRPWAFKAPAGRGGTTFSGALGRHNRRRHAQNERRQQYRQTHSIRFGRAFHRSSRSWGENSN
jgi:hypothetical protein